MHSLKCDLANSQKKSGERRARGRIKPLAEWLESARHVALVGEAKVEVDGDATLIFPLTYAGSQGPILGPNRIETTSFQLRASKLS